MIPSASDIPRPVASTNCVTLSRLSLCGTESTIHEYVAQGSKVFTEGFFPILYLVFSRLITLSVFPSSPTPVSSHLSTTFNAATTLSEKFEGVGAKMLEVPNGFLSASKMGSEDYFFLCPAINFIIGSAARQDLFSPVICYR